MPVSTEQKKRKKPVQLTAKSMQYLRDQGYEVGVVEKWIPHVKQRRDLFGILDIVAVKPLSTLGVQCTSDSNVSSRVRKILECPTTTTLMLAGWTILVHGWSKKSDGKWHCRTVDIGKIPISEIREMGLNPFLTRKASTSE